MIQVNAEPTKDKSIEEQNIYEDNPTFKHNNKLLSSFAVSRPHRKVELAGRMQPKFDAKSLKN